MPTTIKLRNSVTTTNAPSSLVQGEVAINITDKKVWVGNAATTPIQLLGDGGSASFTSIAFGAGTVSSPSITFTGDTNTGIYSPAADTIAFTEGGVESMRIDSSGNVGIGTSSPSGYRLNVAGSARLGQTGIDTYIGFGANNDNYFTAGSSGIQVFRNEGTERMRIDSSGNVGIGYSSSRSVANYRTFSLGGTSNGGLLDMVNASGAILGTWYSDSTGSLVINADPNGSFSSSSVQFQVDGTERMRITSGGTLCVGTTNEDSSRANIVHTGTPARVLRVGAESGSFTGNLYEGYGARISTNGTYKLIQVLNGNATGLFEVLDSGNCRNTNNSYGGTSDIKLKENIVDATPKLADLCKVKVRHYNFKNKPDEKQIGVVAQELEEVFAGLVEETADKDKDGNDLGTTTKSVKYSVFVPMLVKAIQEQQAMIEELKQEVAKLKGV